MKSEGNFMFGSSGRYRNPLSGGRIKDSEGIGVGATVVEMLNSKW